MTRREWLGRWGALPVWTAAGCHRGGMAAAPLRVGMELSYPPFEMTDERGAPAGVSVDMAGALAEFLGRGLEVMNIPFTGLISSLKTGKIDLIISSLTVNEERAKSIDFSEPYVRTGLCLLTGVDSGISGIGDVDRAGRTVVVNQGTTGHMYAETNIGQAKLKVLEKEQNCVLEVVQGRADVFIYDQMSVYQNWRRYPERTKAILKPFQQESWAVGIRKGDEAMLRSVNRFLAEFRAGGSFDRLADKHLAEQRAAFRELGYPFVF